MGSWGLNLFVLFELRPATFASFRRFLRIEFICIIWTEFDTLLASIGSWGLNLFVLFELKIDELSELLVLEDWIYLYYLNHLRGWRNGSLFLRIEFICIIWTMNMLNVLKQSSWGLNLFVLFEHIDLCVLDVLRSWGLDNKKKYCYFLGVTLTATYSHIPSVLIGKPQPTRPELMIFV